MPMMLEFKDVDTYYGDLHVLKKVNYAIEEGEIIALLGGNACGKSTTMKTIMGVVQANAWPGDLRWQTDREAGDSGTCAPRDRAGAGSATAVPTHDRV